MASEQLIVFLKATHSGMVESLLRNLAPLRPVQLRIAPENARSEIEPWLQDGWTFAPQQDGDLGQRLNRAFADVFSGGAERVVIIGSDYPEVKTADVRTAWKELKAHDLVLGPAVDGGYWLIGLRAPRPELFEQIAWGSDQVLAETLTRARSSRLRIQLLRIMGNIDTEAD